jgi:threonine/homoserine/homoserine lactone efflux protein
MELSIWENLLLGVLVLGVVFWMWPGIGNAMQMSRKAESDWASFWVPIGGVVLFVIFLVMLSR